jgi:hypothetical protein
MRSFFGIVWKIPFLNRRRFQRFALLPVVPGTCIYDEPAGQKELRVTLTNVSEAGLYLQTLDHKLPLGKFCKLLFKSPINGKTFPMSGKVIRVGRSGPVCHYYAAIKFENTDKETIKSLLSSLVKKPL